MNLNFDHTLAEKYKSQSQKIRVMSENWAINNLFCPCCGNIKLLKVPNNYPVADFKCNNCNAIFELKSKQGSIGNKIVNGAFVNTKKNVTTNNIEAKIRQSLQFLRDKKFIKFIGRGHYQKI